MKEINIKNVVERRRNAIAGAVKNRNSNDDHLKAFNKTIKASKRRDALAQEIARAFGEEAQLQLYQTCCRKYPLRLIFRAYAEARSVPKEKVKRSRAAIFFYLIKHYSHEQETQTASNHPRH